MPAILLDTNLLVYAFDVRSQGKHSRAWSLLFHLESTRTACLSVGCLGEFFSVMTTKFHLFPGEVLEQVPAWGGSLPDPGPDAPSRARSGTRGARSPTRVL